MAIKAKNLRAILAEVETELGGLLKAEQARLVKSREEDEGASPSASASGGSPSASSSGGDEGGAPPSGDPAASAAPTAAPSAAPSAPPSEGAPPPPEDGAMDPAAAGGEAEITDPAQLEPEYDKLSVESLKAHYLAAKAALYKKMEAAGAGAPSASADPSAAGMGAPGMGAPPPAAAPSPAPMASPGVMKKEVNSTTFPNDPSGEFSPNVAKSEVEAGLEAQVAALAKVVELLANQPVRKAVTEVPFVPKSGEGASEAKAIPTGVALTKKLTEVTSDPKLAKADRELINGYFDGRVQVGQLAHLLK